jgi:hypothetical protein
MAHVAKMGGGNTKRRSPTDQKKSKLKKVYSPGQDAYTFPLQMAVNNTLQFRNE